MMVLSLFLTCAQTSLGGVSSGRENVILSLVLVLLMLVLVTVSSSEFLLYRRRVRYPLEEM
jgi:hypothetical protein